MKLYQERVLNNDEVAKEFSDFGNLYGKRWHRWEADDRQVYDQTQYNTFQFYFVDAKLCCMFNMPSNDVFFR